MLRYQRTYQDHLRFFAVQGFLNVLPFLALQLYYVNVVQQTGMDTLSFVSLVGSSVSVPLLLVQSCYAVFADRLSRSVAVNAIVEQYHRSSIVAAPPPSAAVDIAEPSRATCSSGTGGVEMASQSPHARADASDCEDDEDDEDEMGDEDEVETSDSDDDDDDDDESIDVVVVTWSSMEA